MSLDINLDAINDYKELTELATVYKLLYDYASFKAVAVHSRLKGNIDQAVYFEGLCDRAYKKIPKKYRAW